MSELRVKIFFFLVFTLISQEKQNNTDERFIKDLELL